MITGSLAVLEEPTDEPLEGYLHDSHLPALSVERTQEQMDGTPIQQGKAAARIDTVDKEISAGPYHDADGVFIDVERVESRRRVVTDWAADITKSGVVLASSVEGSDPPFPIGLFWTVTGQKPVLQEIDVGAMHAAWSDDDVLGDVWMVTADDGDDATSIDYHDAANPEDAPTIGLGFSRPWGGTGMRGVVYESGYIAIYSASTAEQGVHFIAEEILPFADEFVGEADDAQQTLDEATEDETETCENCGHERDHIEPHSELDLDLCLSCSTYYEEEGLLPDGNGSIEEVSA